MFPSMKALSCVSSKMGALVLMSVLNPLISMVRRGSSYNLKLYFRFVMELRQE